MNLAERIAERDRHVEDLSRAHFSACLGWLIAAICSAATTLYNFTHLAWVQAATAAAMAVVGAYLAVHHWRAMTRCPSQRQCSVPQTRSSRS
jgi:hypothetical protein